MQSTNIPTKIPIPFANSASSTYKTTIPQASQIGIANGRASLTDGFPPLTFQGISSGGIPPFGADFNGILYEITSITQWQQAGGMFLYDSSFSTTISGYPRGSVLQSSSLNGLWISSAENNTTNPDTGGAGWTSLAFEGSQSISVTSADVTLTQLQSAYPILIISGAQTAARNLIFPAIVGEWIVQNNTTGAFTLTAKTASGTGVTLTQGQSTYVYGDGTNIYFADSAKVASFNGRVGTVTLNATDVTTALGYIPVNKAGDTMSGSLTNSSGFVGPLTGNVTGNVTGNSGTTSQTNFTNLTIGSSQVLYAGNYNNYAPTLTGTGASGTWGISITGNAATATNATTSAATSSLNSTAIANQFASLGATNGYQKLPSGLIIQWGFVSTSSEGLYTTTFPITFPNAVWNINATPFFNTGAGNGDWNTVLYQPTTTSYATFWQNLQPSGSGSPPFGFYWIALGW